MLETLKLVRSAVARKDFVPTLTHFRIANGTILGGNGEIAICSPIGLDLDCCPKAEELVLAIQACRDTIEMQLTPNGRLLVRSGTFTARVSCLAEGYPPIAPEGNRVEIDGDALITALEALSPFIAVDASRPWARGVLVRDGSAFATNNIVLVQKWLGIPTPAINIPHEAVKVLLKLGEAPKAIQVGESSISFLFEGEHRWLRCQLLSTEWPDVASILDRASVDLRKVGPAFFDALDDVAPFADELERVYLLDGTRVATDVSPDAGASVTVPDGVGSPACYNVHQLARLRGIANMLDLGAYPGPALFFGDSLRGAIVGINVEGFTR